MSVSTAQSLEHRQLDRGVRVTVARTKAEAEALRPWFERLQPANVHADLDFVLTVSRCGEPAIRPHIVLCELEGDRAILAVGRVEQQDRSGVLRRRGVRTLRLAFGGVVGAETVDGWRLVLETLCHPLAEREVDAVVIPQLDPDGPLYAVVRSAAPWWRVDHLTRRNIHWRASVPDSLELFLERRSTNTRYHVRRYTKRLVRASGENLVVREFRDPADLDRLCADLESVAAKTYQRGLGVGYTGDPEQRAILRLCASREWLRAWVLYMSETPVAFWFGYCYAGTFWLVATGFDPIHAEMRVGQYLQMQMMDSLCRDPDVHTFDYGAGDAEYKRRFGDDAVTESDAWLYGASVTAARVNAMRTARLAVSRLARELIARTQLGVRAKKAWRKRAERRAKSQAV